MYYGGFKNAEKPWAFGMFSKSTTDGELENLAPSALQSNAQEERRIATQDVCTLELIYRKYFWIDKCFALLNMLHVL